MKTVRDDLTQTTRKSELTDQTLTARRSRFGPNIWLSLTILGGAIVAVSLASYQVVLSIDRTVGIEQAGLLEQDAYATLFLILAGLSLAFLGVSYFLRTLRPGERSSSIFATVSMILREKWYARIFVLSALGYGLVFAAVSSTLVYQPGVTFSEAYGVQVPSILPVVCCGSIGQVPQFVIYITQQVAILLIPINVVLLFTVSWLVGLNASVAAFAYKNRPQTAGGQWIGSLGAIIGLFTACPTCAGFFLLTILGLSGAISLALTLTSLQGLFILAGIPILVATPLLTSRRITSGDARVCLIPRDKANLPLH